MAEKMTLEQVRDWHLARDREQRIVGFNLGATNHRGMADAINAHLAPPAQAVDVGAIREVIERVAADNHRSALTLGVEGLRGQCIETAKELHKLTRAIGNAREEGWISVKDRLPKCNSKPRSFGVCVLIHPHYKSDGASDMPIAFYGRRQTAEPNFYIHGNVLNHVTHWMPIPDPPQPEE